jgi:hypothetical protein
MVRRGEAQPKRGDWVAATLDYVDHPCNLNTRKRHPNLSLQKIVHIDVSSLPPFLWDERV